MPTLPWPCLGHLLSIEVVDLDPPFRRCAHHHQHQRGQRKRETSVADPRICQHLRSATKTKSRNLSLRSRNCRSRNHGTSSTSICGACSAPAHWSEGNITGPRLAKHSMGILWNCSSLEIHNVSEKIFMQGWNRTGREKYYGAQARKTLCWMWKHSLRGVMIREIRQRFLQMVTLLNALSDLVVFCALGVHGCMCFAQKEKLNIRRDVPKSQVGWFTSLANWQISV